METDTVNYYIFKNISQSLKEKSKIIYTTLNELFQLFHRINDFHATSLVGDNAK